jgi:hypothetical protein
MKAAPLLLLVLGAAPAFSCETYYYCHCYNNDGSPNNASTTNVCTYWYGASIANGPDALECSLGDGMAMNNRDFRKLCQVAFATGSDSSYRDKYKSGSCTPSKK